MWTRRRRRCLPQRARLSASYTPARIGLERTGVSLATGPLLDFQLAHARARDAVHAAIDVRMMCDELRRHGLPALALKSKAGDRSTYLRRPDLGRRLSENSATVLKPGEYDVVFVDRRRPLRAGCREGTRSICYVRSCP